MHVYVWVFRVCFYVVYACRSVNMVVCAYACVRMVVCVILFMAGVVVYGGCCSLWRMCVLMRASLLTYVGVTLR